jgi:hypothetical protein
MPFDPPVIDTDEEAVTDRILAGLSDRIEDWEPVEGAPEVALAEELGREIASLHQVAIDVLELAVAGFGETAFAFPAFQGAVAEIPVEITVNQTGTIIPVGFIVAGINDNGDEVAFELEADLPAPTLTVAATLAAVDPGLGGNGVPAGELTVVTATTMVDTVTAVGPSVDGADPEQIEDYLNRLTDYLGTLRPGGVNAADLAALARSVPGVHRALAVDLYDPADPGTPAERTVTVFPVDETGHPIAPAAVTQLQQILEDAREVNFVVHVEDPTYTPVAIDYAVVAEPDAETAVVQAEINVALANMITSWGTTTSNEQAWVEKTTMRVIDIVRVIGAVPGAAYIDTLTVNGGTSEVVLGGPAALPAPLDAAIPSTITGSVS